MHECIWLVWDWIQEMYSQYNRFLLQNPDFSAITAIFHMEIAFAYKINVDKSCGHQFVPLEAVIVMIYLLS